MEQNLAVKRAIEQVLQTAQVTSEKEVMPGVFETRVQLPLATVAQTLAQFYITQGYVPAVQKDEASDVVPVS
jgi:hypothetical protein